MDVQDPLGLNSREFAVDVSHGESGGFRYRLTITRGTLVEFASPWEPLIAATEEDARAEARERVMLVMAMVMGAHVESLTPPPQHCQCGGVPLPDGRTVQVRWQGVIVHHVPEDERRCWREPCAQ